MTAVNLRAQSYINIMWICVDMYMYITRIWEAFHNIDASNFYHIFEAHNQGNYNNIHSIIISHKHRRPWID